MMKFALLAVLPLQLSACAIPAAVVVTAAADGVTFLSSGKSVTSHTLTAATDKDCSLLFGITRGEFCKEKEKSNGYAYRDAGFVLPNDDPTVGEHVTAPAAKRPEAGQPQWTLVLGSFADYRSAVDLARQVKPEQGLVTMTSVGGEVNYLVSTGPLRRDQDVGRQLNITALKLDNVKLMPVCPARMQNQKCVALDQTLEVQQATLP